MIHPAMTLSPRQTILLKTEYIDRDIVKLIPGRRWAPEYNKSWELPLTIESYAAVIEKFPSVTVDPSIREELTARVQRIQDVAAIKESTTVEPVSPMPVKTKPFTHQIRAYNIGMKLPNAGFFMEQGCGKSMAAIAVAGRRFLDGQIKRILIVCPASVIPVWEREFALHAYFVYCIHALDGNTEKRITMLADWPETPDKLQVAVINYEGLWRMIPHENAYAWSVGKSVFSKWIPDMIITDECHPSGVLIDAPKGSTPIEKIRINDVIFGYDHLKNKIVKTKVLNVFKRITSENIIAVNGVKMTPSHPVYTANNGYVPAKELTSFDTLCYNGLKIERSRVVNGGNEVPEDMRVLQEIVYGEYSDKAILQPVMQKQRPIYQKTRTAFAKRNKYATNFKQRGSSCKNTSTVKIGCKSFQGSCEQTQSADLFARKRVCNVKRWKRKRNVFAAKNTCRAVGMANRICFQHKTWDKGISFALQNRYSRSSLKNCNRSRWKLTQLLENKNERYQENKILGIKRLESVEIHKRKCFEKHGYCYGEDNGCSTVYNIETETHNYFAEGLLVHNCQRIKNSTAKQSRALHALGRVAQYKLALTGTPVTQSPLDLFSEYKFLQPEIFGTVWLTFRNHYAVYGGYGGYELKTYKNMPELIQKAHSIAYRVTKSEALDLPEYTDQNLYCYLEPAAERRYKQMAQESIMELSSGGTVTAMNVLSRLLRLSQLTGGYVQNADTEKIEQVSTAKMDLLAETISDIVVDAGKKVVIFVRFLPEIAEIRNMLDKLKIGYAWIAGEVKDRGEQVRMFQEDSKCFVFIAQEQTAGLGITLTAADISIFYSLNFSFADYDQCRARIHRLGQKNKCTYIHMLARNTIDEKVMSALGKKASIADEVINNWRMYFTTDK